MTPQVGVIMGSSSDWDAVMKFAHEMLDTLEVPHECEVVSAHRTPEKMMAYAQSAHQRGLRVIIAGAGGAAHLPGMVASEAVIPVIGVPVPGRVLDGMDSLLSINQMPAGCPVATMAIGKAGAINAAIYAARILSLHDEALASRLAKLRSDRAAAVNAEKLL